jgi:hypothetical protein
MIILHIQNFNFDFVPSTSFFNRDPAKRRHLRRSHHFVAALRRDLHMLEVISD